MRRRTRPLGLTLALAACTVLYGFYPLAQALFYLVLAGRRQMMGLDLRAVLTLIASVIMLALLVPAWRGRPPQIRLVLTAAVVILMALNLAFALGDLLNRSTDIIADSTTDLRRAADYCSFPLYVLVTAYIVWYLNRHPSRAYYGQ